ncbi:MAG TPA: hypothetical protein ENI27_08570 [bacterium]|nr:hypothetical protein [bacterium]
MKSLKESIAVFDPKDLRVAVSIYKCLARNGFKSSDLVEHFDEAKRKEEILQKISAADTKKRLEEGRKAWEAIASPCPNCGAPLFLKHICKKKGPENVKGYTCLWHCEHGDCTYEKYTYENAGEEVKKLMKGRKKNGN